MPNFMLDTNAIDYIVECNLLFEKVTSSVKSGEITLFITHIQQEEVNEIPALKNAERRLKIQSFIQNYCNRVPTVGAICGISACGECMPSDGEDIVTITNNSRQIGKDALIAVTAKSSFNYLVTNDRKLKIRMSKAFPEIKILKNHEFEAYFFQNDNKYSAKIQSPF